MFTGAVDYFQGFNRAVDVISKTGNIVYPSLRAPVPQYVYIPAILSALFLLLPGLAARWLSPRNGSGGYLLTDGFWVISGYFMALTGLGLLYVFE